ncbi:MAG TPA: DUF5674 family protein [Candidatus Binatia bacterium]|nr:DUF5674 family protein [Candidatus Binatia bacterium]
MAPGEIHVLREHIDPGLLARLVRETFEVMVKYVADIEHGIIAIGGELHADAEALLLESGSNPANVWGANYYPGRGPDGCIEFTSLINISPARGNPGMEVLDPSIRQRIRLLTIALIGEGEPLP